MPTLAEFHSLPIGALSGAIVGFAMFRSRWFFELALGAIAAAILCGIVVDGPDGYVAWVRFTVAAAGGYGLFLAAAAFGLAAGAFLGVLTRRRPA